MATQKYSVNQYLIESILSSVKSNEIAIPEIQRPFVWDAIKVRDLMDSLYQGFPIGYLIAWRNPNVRLKDGTVAEGKKILIDGQQRVAALAAAILGEKIVTKEYKKVRIKIAFHPVKQTFEVSNPAIEKDHSWIEDISPILSGRVRQWDVINEYCEKNPDISRNEIEDAFASLIDIPKKQIGLIELAPELDIETVTEIFIRINSEGVVLSQADFAMSKIAANEKYDGHVLRKCIDYFCHLAVSPEFFSHISEVDKEFTQTDYFLKMSWLRNEKDDLYDPSYSDLLRVSFTNEFERGKLSDLVSLLSGRNFETRTYEEEIAKESFVRLKKGIFDFINETNFKRFLMIIRSAGFISPSLIRSQNALNFAYIVYLKLKEKEYDSNDIETFVKKWFVLSILTGRYSGSAESKFDFDIKQIASRDFRDFLTDTEEAELSDAFWNTALVQDMNTSVASSPYFNVFLAAQVKGNDRGFLSKDITITDLITHRGDIHHIFPKDYLKKQGMTRGEYNQIANYVYMQSEINIKVANKSPNIYFNEIKGKCERGEMIYSGISSIEDLRTNLKANCISEDIFEMDIDRYDEFLVQRRRLMAQKIKNYYLSL